MKKRNRTEHHAFIPGELYLSHPSDRSCPATGSLLGIYDKTSDGNLYLESSSWDLQEFDFWYALSLPYGYSRLSTRSELRDYMSNLFLDETTRSGRLELRLFR